MEVTLTTTPRPEASRAAARPWPSVVRSSVRIRPIAGIDAGMRVLLNGQHYDIKAVLPGGRRGWVDLVCEVAA